MDRIDTITTTAIEISAAWTPSRDDLENLAIEQDSMNLHALTSELLDRSAQMQDLDAALLPLMEAVDPANQYDLGGEAGHYFSRDVGYIAPMDNEPAEGPALTVWNLIDANTRRRLLMDFFQTVEASQR